MIEHPTTTFSQSIAPTERIEGVGHLEHAGKIVDTDRFDTVELCLHDFPSGKLTGEHPENKTFFLETNLPTQMTARVYVNFLEGIYNTRHSIVATDCCS